MRPSLTAESTRLVASAVAASVTAFFPLNAGAEGEFKSVAKLTGVAKVKDGDGVLFGKVEIRLQGIAAPAAVGGRCHRIGDQVVRLTHRTGGDVDPVVVAASDDVVADHGTDSDDQYAVAT